jgi:hypothetical protein
MRARLWCLAVAGLLAVPGLARPDTDTSPKKPTLVIQVKSIDGLLGDIKLLAGLGGRSEDVKKIDGAINAVFPKGISGVDTKRPLGLYGTIDADGNLFDSSAVLMIPVTEEKAFLDLLQERAKLTAKKEDDGVYSATPDGFPFAVYFRFVNNYVYATIRNKATIDKSKLLQPSNVFPADRAATLAASFRLDQIPNSFKQIIISQAELRMADLEDENAKGETAAQHALKIQVAKEIVQRFTALIKDGSELAVRLDVNDKNKELVAEFMVTGKSDSPLAAEIARLGKSQSLLAGLLRKDAAVSLLLHGALPKSINRLIGPVFDEGVAASLKKEKDPAARAQAQKIINALKPTLESGELDTALSMVGPTSNKHYALVAAMKVTGGDKIEQVLKDLVALLPEPVRGQIKIDAETAGDAKIHRVDAQRGFDAEAKRTLGENPFYFAFRSNAVFVAGGEGGLDALKAALSAPAQSAPPLRVDVSLARLVPSMPKAGKGDAKSAAEKAFTGKDDDRIRITLEGGKALKGRFTMKTQVVKFFSLMNEKGK